MVETFDRPLVIGYVGFDVRVLEDGSLSAPIPSFSVVTRRVAPAQFVPAVGFDYDALGDGYVEFLDVPDNRGRIEAWLQERGVTDDPADLVHSPDATHRRVLREAATEFGFGKSRR
jgi:hypothetical protein